MRFLVFLFFFSFLNLISVYSQDKLLGILPIVDSKVTYIGVIEVDGVSKDDLYYRAKRWFIDYYNSGKDVIQLDDKENGEIIGKGFFTKIWVASALLKPIDVNVWQTVTIQVKDGKFRYMISDFQIRYFSSGGGGVSSSTIDKPLENWQRDRDSNMLKFYPKIDDGVKSIIASIELSMKTQKSNDW